MRKGLMSMALIGQRAKVIEYAQIEMGVKRKARYFILWYEAIANHRTA